MTAKSNNLIFFGNERLASGVKTDTPIVRALIDAGYAIDFIVVSQKAIRGRRSRDLEILDVASEHGIEVKSVSKLSEVTEDIKKSGAKFAVLAAFGKIVPQATIDLFEYGILNIHPSLLPKYRGSSPIEAAILDGDPTGVSIMALVAEMDAGPIYGAVEASIDPGSSKQQYYSALSAAGAQKLVEILPDIIDGQISPREQNPDQATYTNRITKEDGRIDWSKPAQQIEREIRAYFGWPGSYAAINSKDIAITKAVVINENGDPGSQFMISKSRFGVYCGDGAIEILELKPAGKQAMSAQAYMAGNSII